MNDWGGGSLQPENLASGLTVTKSTGSGAWRRPVFRAFPAMILGFWMSLAFGDIEEVRHLIAQDRLEAATEMLDGMPDDLEARLLRGVVQSKQGELDEATRTFEKLAEDHPDLPQPLNNLAVLYAARGMTEQARATLLRAVELQPRHANAHRNLGDLYLHMALDSYGTAYNLEPDSRHLERKISLLDQVLGGGSAIAQPRTVIRETEPKQLAENTVNSTATSDTNGEYTVESGEAVETTSEPAEEPVTQEPIQVATVEPVADPLATLTAAAVDDRCFSVGPFLSDKAAGFAESWLMDRGVNVLEREKKRMPVGVIYQVYLDPAGSRDDARVLLSDLNAKGIRDAVIIGTGVLKNGISLGAFKEESRAKKHLAWLARRDVSGAAYRTQRPDRNTIWLLSSLSEGASFEHDAFGTDFPRKKRVTAICE